MREQVLRMLLDGPCSCRVPVRMTVTGNSSLGQIPHYKRSALRAFTAMDNAGEYYIHTLFSTSSQCHDMVPTL